MPNALSLTTAPALGSPGLRLLALGGLAGSVAHEINNPLAGIRNAAALLRMAGQSDADRERYAGIVDREVANIALFVRSLYEALECSTQPSGDTKVAEALREVVRAVRPPEGSVEITIDPADEACIVDAPVAIVRLVVSAQVRSALGQAPPGVPVSVRVARDAADIVVQVTAEQVGPDQTDRLMPNAGLRFAMDVLQLFDGSLTIEAGAAGRSFISRWPCHPVVEDQCRE
jgi:signal transduction histidine kinase